MTKRNNGVYEPEFRLVLMFPALVLGSIGYFGFGWSIELGDKWIVPVILYGLVGIGGVFLAIPVYTYVVDSHRALAPEAFVTVHSPPSNLFTLLRLTYYTCPHSRGGPSRYNLWGV